MDARRAIDRRPQKGYVKAYHYLVKGLIELNLLREAKVNLLAAINRCGICKEFSTLEDILVLKFGGHPIRPKSNDFDILQEIGEGNFTKIFKVQYKKTGLIYAMKTIDKMTAERMKRRHPNIHNEIMMEKKVLAKLEGSPLVVQLYSTFQDSSTLYYQMEYCSGGELWTFLKDDNGGMPASVGCYHSLAQFFMLEAVNALEYMHR